jgi:hypothetical protein
LNPPFKPSIAEIERQIDELEKLIAETIDGDDSLRRQKERMLQVKGIGPVVPPPCWPRSRSSAPSTASRSRPSPDSPRSTATADFEKGSGRSLSTLLGFDRSQKTRGSKLTNYGQTPFEPSGLRWM